MSIGIIDYEVLAFFSEKTIEDEEYISHPRDLYIYNNNITRTNECPPELNTIGTTLKLIYGNKCDMSEILWDGITSLDVLKDDLSICVHNSGSIDDLDVVNFGGAEHNLVRDVEHFDCNDKESLPPVEVLAPTL